MYVEYTKSGKLVKQVKVFVSLELNCQSDVSYNFDILWIFHANLEILLVMSILLLLIEQN